MNKIETEVKYKIRASDVPRIVDRAKRAGFAASRSEAVRDCFLSINPSPHGGWDFVRLRDVDGRAFYRTEKLWICDKGGRRVRQEIERSLTAPYFKRLTKKKMGVEIQKDRTNLRGRIGGRKITLSIDAVAVNGKIYHFIEGEAITDVESSHAIREEIKAWLHDTLEINTTREAPGMLDFIWSVMGKRP